MRRLAVGNLSLALNAPPGCTDLDAAFQDIAWSTQLTVVLPLWSNKPPSAVRDLFERWRESSWLDGARACERSLSLVITMAMPAFAHRAMVHCGGTEKPAASLSLPGFPEMKQNFIGSVDSISAGERIWWIKAMRAAGAAAL